MGEARKPETKIPPSDDILIDDELLDEATVKTRDVDGVQSAGRLPTLLSPSPCGLTKTPDAMHKPDLDRINIAERPSAAATHRAAGLIDVLVGTRGL